MSEVDLSVNAMREKMAQLEEDFSILHCDKETIDNLSRITGIKFVSLHSDDRIGMWVNAKEYDNYWSEYNKRLFEPYLNEAIKDRQIQRGEI